MRIRLAILTTMVLIAVCAAPLMAHHSVASEFDASKVMTIKGVITRLEWINPHAWIYMEVKTVDGKIESWRVELGAPNSLFRDGFRKELVNLTDTYTMEMWLARNGSKIGGGRVLTLPDGRKFDVSDKFSQGPIIFSPGGGTR